MNHWSDYLAPILRALSAFGTALVRRIGPFLDLLDARYLPLLAVVAPQSYTVYAWLLRDGAPPWVAIMGGLGYETVYVGAVAWAERGAGWKAARMPAITALVFSVAVAVAYYAPLVGVLAILHAGFPLVAYAYTVMMHTPHERPARTVRVRVFGFEVFGAQPILDAEPVRALPTHQESAERTVVVPSAHACARCGASVESQQKAAASVRWGCGACKEKVIA